MALHIPSARRTFSATTVFLVLAACTLGRADTTATGELDTRMAMARDRLTSGAEPAFTDDFILADAEPDEKVGKRRFDNFHGDLSGRYLSALAVLPRDQHPPHLPLLVDKLIAMQQPDGRFGRASLQFTADKINNEHMALLWGNGRLLVGLMDYHRAYPSDAVVASARKLGDFLLTVIEPCSSPEVAARLEGRKAYGYICFTQLTEGLVMLADQAAEPKYAAAARQIYPFLPERGLQHSHGYLATLRGVMLLYAQDEHPDDLAFAEKRFKALVASPDLMPFGGVNEYFGPFEDHKHQLRDEGCSEADFVELALQLWQATDESDYLQRAEFCLLNELSFNQFKSGDFGHHNLNSRVGYRMGDQQHKAWWCCTMHGLRLLKVAKDYVISRGRHAHYVNLYTDHKYHGEQMSLTLAQPDKTETSYRLTVDSALATTQLLGIRTPQWANATELKLNGKPTSAAQVLAGDYLMMERVWQPGEILEISHDYKLRVLAEDGSEIDIQRTTGTVQGYLHYGPHLLAADGNMAEAFLSEPVDNTIHWDTVSHAFDKAPDTAQRPWAYLQFSYTHAGFPGTWKVILRPIGELAFEDRTFLKARLKFSRNP